MHKQVVLPELVNTVATAVVKKLWVKNKSRTDKQRLNSLIKIISHVQEEAMAKQHSKYKLRRRQNLADSQEISTKGQTDYHSAINNHRKLHNCQ